MVRIEKINRAEKMLTNAYKSMNRASMSLKEFWDLDDSEMEEMSEICRTDSMCMEWVKDIREQHETLEFLLSHLHNAGVLDEAYND